MKSGRARFVPGLVPGLPGLAHLFLTMTKNVQGPFLVTLEGGNNDPGVALFSLVGARFGFAGIWTTCE